MTRLFLAAGVAAMAIASAAAAKPGGGNGGGHGGGGGAPQAQQGGGGGHGNGGGGGHGGGRGGGGGGFAMPQMRGGGGGGGHGGGFAVPRQQMQRFAQPRQERQQFRAQRFEQARNRGFERQQMRAQRMEARNNGFQRQQMRAERMQQARNDRQLRASRVQQAQNRGFERQQMRAQRIEQARNFQQVRNGNFNRHAQRMQGFAEARNRDFVRQQMRNSPMRAIQQTALLGRDFRGDRARYRGLPPGQQWKLDRDQQLAYAQNWNSSRFAALDYGGRTRIAPFSDVVTYVGAPVASFAALTALPQSVSYLYPDTSDYYYRYGDGYLYEVNRSDNVIAALLPLIGGGYLPGSYLPQPYMASYVPDYYGFESFYPDYGDSCNRYANGVIYEVDCYSGMVEDVIPLYASGYGVGQILPASYGYYNVPYQYRDVYYDTPDYGYWYAPGAIYQYDRGSSMITSVAALLSPGFAVGQPLPAGYDVYNVPYSYRETYYDTPNAWYRYNNGYIYQVDPVTRLVTAIVASLLT